MDIQCILECECFLMAYFLIVRWVVIFYPAGHRFNVDEIEIVLWDGEKQYIWVNMVSTSKEYTKNSQCDWLWVDENAIQDELWTSSAEFVSSVHVYIIDATTSSWFGKCKVHQIRWISNAKYSMLAFLSSTLVMQEFEVALSHWI